MILLFTLMFFFLLGFLFLMIQIGLLGYAFEKIGIGPSQMFLFLLISLVGSRINIPITRIPQEPFFASEIISVFGIHYRIPVARRRETVLAVNVGGALMPIALSLYLLLGTGQVIAVVIATAIVALGTFKLARPVRGLGIAVPGFFPAIIAALAALVLASQSPPVAYIAGTMGTLIGADLLRLDNIRRLGSAMVSIGGAGTFDGIFLAGIIAVLLAV